MSDTYKNKKPFKSIIFDLDGTLVNSLQDLADSMNTALVQMGYTTHEMDKYRYFIGRGISNLIKAALPQDAQSEDQLEEARRRFDEYYRAHYLDHTYPYEGIVSLIDTLKKEGYPLAVVSNKPQEFVEKIMAKLFPHQFDVTLGQREGIPRKPDPTGVFEACSAMGVQARDCLYLGDSGTDMQTAIAAGAFPLGVLWGFREREEIEAHGAKAVIAAPDEVLTLIHI